MKRFVLFVMLSFVITACVSEESAPVIQTQEQLGPTLTQIPTQTPTIYDEWNEYVTEVNRHYSLYLDSLRKANQATKAESVPLLKQAMAEASVNLGDAVSIKADCEQCRQVNIKLRKLLQINDWLEKNVDNDDVGLYQWDEMTKTFAEAKLEVEWLIEE